MNNARIWLVVKPGIGIPVFLAGVAAIALLIHAVVLTHTTWYPAYLQGNQKAKVSMIETTPATPASATSTAVAVLASK
jgi:light-harvesting protein B-800-850 alpha chain